MDPPNPNPNLSALVNPQEYSRTKEMIQSARSWMDQVEAHNEAGLQAFAYTEQELQRRIREGREAEMLAAQLRARNLPQQTFVAQQPQVTTWQVSPIPLSNAYQQVFPTSARIEEIPSVPPERTSRSGSRPTPQRNDSNFNHRSQQFVQPEIPRSANASYEQFYDYNNAPAQPTTFIAHDFHSGQSSRRKSYHPPPAVHIPAVPVQQPPPPIVHQPPPQQEPPRHVASASSSTTSYPIPVHNVTGSQRTTGQDQNAARHEFVNSLFEILQKHPEEVQMKAISQIFEYINGKQNPNPQIRGLGDQLKQVGGSDPRELLNSVRAKLMEQKKARQAAKAKTPQVQPQPAPQPRFQTIQSEQLPQSRPQSTNITANFGDGAPYQSLSQQQVLQKLIQTYSHEVGESKIDIRKLGDIISIAYVSARLKQPPKDPDIWVRRIWDMFEKHFPVDRLPSVFANLLVQLKRPIPNVPVSTEPPTMGRSSSSLAGALVDSSSNVTPSTVMQQSNVVAQPPDDSTVIQSGASDALPEAHIPQSRDPAPTSASRTQATGNTSHISTQLSAPPSITSVNPPYPTTANQYTTTVTNNATRQGHQLMNYSQLALVPTRNIVPSIIQREIRHPQLPGWTPYYQPGASTSTLPRQPPIKSRFPRQANRSRLAKDILKQLGKPSGSVPAVPTRHEYEERRKAEARTEATLVHPSTEPVIAELQPPSSRDYSPLPTNVGSVQDQVMPSANSPPVTPVGGPPLLGYPDPDTDPTPCDANATGEDVNMDIQPPENPLVPQPSASPRLNLPQEFVPSLVVPESALDKGERPAADHPPLSEPPSSKRSGPPPDAEIIEISDDEELVAIHATASTIEPMEVDEEVGTGGAISQGLSELSLDGVDTLVAVETEKDRTNRWPSQEPINSGDMQFTERKLQKNRPSVEVPPLPDYARRYKGKERAPIRGENEEDPELRAVVDLAFSRLRPTRCLWLGCKATLNSVDNLVKHMKIHADETERTSDNLECQWKKCTRSYRTRVKLDRHCVHHAQKVLHCPYEDCGEEFRDAVELLDHTKDMHENSDLLPSTNPVPCPKRAPDALPQQVPSWSIFPVSVAPVPISVDRHGQIGRWVARNICGTAKRSDSSRRLRSSRRFDTGKHKSTASEREDMMNEERFGFLSSTDDGNALFTDIPSEAVSSYCRYGLLTLYDNDGHPDMGQDSSRKQLEFKGIDDDNDDGAVRSDVPVEEEMISLELEPASSEDELLLKPANP